MKTYDSVRAENKVCTPKEKIWNIKKKSTLISPKKYRSRKKKLLPEIKV